MSELTRLNDSPQESTVPKAGAESTRRSMMKTTLMTAAGAILGATLSSPAEAQTGGGTGHLNVFVQPKIPSTYLHQAISELIPKFYGCTTCGILGPPLTFRAVQNNYGTLGLNILDAVHTTTSQGKVEVLVQSNVDLNSLHSALDAIIGHLGCVGCGLTGFDFSFTPVENNLGNLGIPGIIGAVNDAP